MNKLNLSGKGMLGNNRVQGQPVEMVSWFMETSA